MTTVTQLEDFSKAEHTLVVSDLHLADAEPPHPHNPLWKRFKRPKLFIDRDFKKFLEYVTGESKGSFELILNGDIFDFDSVMAIPPNPPFKVSWIEGMRGLASEEEKSKFKIQTILHDHAVWVESLREFLMKGNRMIFVIGNHDMELHWPAVQQAIIDALDLPDQFKGHVRFCEWFYLSNGDTLVEHGNQYDEYCVCANPIHPLVKKGSRALVRLPFGNLAGKFMTNGMGLFNPHVDSSYIKSSFKEYMVFFYKYMLRVQPFIIWTWFWSAMVTVIHSVSEGLLPALKDPLTVENRVQGIADRANSTPRVVRSLRELHAHPAFFNPYKILKELWLDRALILLAILFASFWFFSALNVFINVSFWWFVIPAVLLMPSFVFYAKSVTSEVYTTQTAALKQIGLSAQITQVSRVVLGHTHRQHHIWIDGIEVVNTGTWSPAYYDVECTQPYGKKCFAWIQPNESGSGRVAGLYEWMGDNYRRIKERKDLTLDRLRSRI